MIQVMRSLIPRSATSVSHRLFSSAKSLSPIKIGVFGGMGPIAGAKFYYDLERCMSVLPEDQRPITYLYSDPTMPRKDVSVHLMLQGGRPDLLIDKLVSGMHFFKEQGVRFVLAPCNTFHYFLPILHEHINIPFIDMIKATSMATANTLGPHEKTVALLSTDATAKSEIYHKELAKLGINVDVPSASGMSDVMRIIELVKNGQENSDLARDLLREVLEVFSEKGIKTAILGCTELPLVKFINTNSIPMKLVSSTQCLIDKAVSECQPLGINNSTHSVRSSTPM